MNFASELLAAHANRLGTVIFRNGFTLKGYLAVNDDSLNIDPGQGYDLQTNGDEDNDTFCCVIAEVPSEEKQEIPNGSPVVELTLGDRVTLRGTLVDRRDGDDGDGLVVLGGEIRLRAIAPNTEPPTDPEAGWRTFESGSVLCVVNAGAVSAGLPDTSDDSGDEGGGGDAAGDDVQTSTAPTGAEVNPD